MTLTDKPVIRGVVADVDGVVYRGESPIPDAVEAFRRWNEAVVPYCFVTNNSTQTAAFFAAKLTRLGVSASPEQVITSSAATAAFLKAQRPDARTAFVLGSAALRSALTEAGLAITEQRPDVVVVGLDRELTYATLKTATRAVLAGATLIGTNPDPRLPVDDGFDPGAGSVLAAVTTATGTEPLIIGKPQPGMIELALGRLGTPRDSTVMIGDQVATDIVAGQRAGLKSILVTTGVPRDHAAAPDLVVDSLLDLFPPDVDGKNRVLP
ncbi:MAG: HAD-IIA family hydrolase [Parafilimonas terrae]|nr:HAD-IIA family hydrolase [Parafilimonas terrae]